MEKIYIDRDVELNPAILKKIILKWEASTAAQMRFHQGYYEGTGQAIMHKHYDDPTKPHNRIVKNYCKTIVDNFTGYICGKPITYITEEAFYECLKENDVQAQDSEWLKQALIAGQAPLLCYMNESEQKRFKVIEPTQVIPVYAADLDEELLYAIYYYPTVDWEAEEWTDKWSINVYDRTSIFHYESGKDFTTISMVAEEEPHYFEEVPFSFLTLDRCVFEPIISLQDAYNTLLTEEVNDFEAFVDAYMVLKNITADSDDIAAMKENRTLLLDDDADAYYLTKNISDTQIQNLLENINKSIHTVSQSPDFASEEFNQGVSSGIALQYKLVGFNNLAATLETAFEKAIDRRTALLNRIYSLTDTEAFTCDCIFNHNLPTDMTYIINMINGLRGLVSEETLLSQIPFIDDVNEEMERKAGEAPSFDEFFTGIE